MATETAKHLTRAIVRRVDGDIALVETTQSGCGRCHEPGGCGGLHAGRIVCASPRLFQAVNPIGAAPGSVVQVAVSEGAVRRAANTAYAIPLLLAVGGGGLGSWLLADSLGQWGGVLGTAVGLLLAWRRMARRTNPAQADKPSLPEIVECEIASAEEAK